MDAIERITITMPADMASMLRQRVETGDYASSSEIIREAVRDWTRAQDAERRDLEQLRDAIREGIDSGTGRSAEEVFADLRARYTAR